MYKELKKFKVNNQFSFSIDDSLEEVCNAAETGSGIFLVYAGDGDDKRADYGWFYWNNPK